MPTSAAGSRLGRPQQRGFTLLELLVVVDVAMSETARLAHYVLPVASQLEKAEATFFNFEFPHNVFHLRRALMAPPEDRSPPWDDPTHFSTQKTMQAATSAHTLNVTKCDSCLLCEFVNMSGL